MSKKKRLGRGLEALLGVGKSDKPTTETPAETKSTSPKTEFELNDPGVEVESVAELHGDSKLGVQDDRSQTSSSFAEPNVTGTDESENPTILKFTGRRDSKKNTTSASGPNSEGPSLEQPDADALDVRRKAAPSAAKPSASTVTDSGSDSNSPVVELNVYDVDDNPFQPRREFNKSEIESLAESLKTHEQLQPILVRRVGERYQLISGERRLRAAVHAGWSKIRAQVREADDRLVAELAIVENLQRKDLNPVEKALSFRRYIDEHGCSQEDLAGRLKIDRSTVANLLRLLELPEVVQKAIQIGIISNGHARALLPLGEEHLQIEFCNRIQREGLSVRAVEKLVREKIDEEDGVKRKSSSKGRTKSGQIVSLENELRNALGTKIEIKPTSRGRGKIVVHYLSREEFDRLRQLFTETPGQPNREAA